MTSHYEKFSLFLVTHLQMKKCPSKRSQLSVFYPSEKCSLLQFIYKQHLLKDKSRTHGYVFLGGKKEAVNKRATVLATRTFQKFAYVETSCRHAVICQKHAASIERFWFFNFFFRSSQSSYTDSNLYLHSGWKRIQCWCTHYYYTCCIYT